VIDYDHETTDQFGHKTLRDCYVSCSIFLYGMIAVP